ncbi:MAG TPA: hypothetical protein VF581_04555 [Flavobacterium sp.]|jgi:hypothetical protein
MELDIETILEDMLAAIKHEAGAGWQQIKDTALQFAERKKERYKLIGELTISGHIPKEKFKSILDDEKLLLESELLALAVISKAAAQRAANAALDILRKAVEGLIGGLLG